MAEVIPPAGRRALIAYLVRCCPYCHHAHLHRGDEVYERRPSCGGAPYLLNVDGVVIP